MLVSGRWKRLAAPALLAAGLVCAQPGAVEIPTQKTALLPQWPTGPPREAMPEWARTGKIRFARWDGGRIETAKAFLSGWPGFNPPSPDFVESMTNWYAPHAIQLLQDAGVNTIWVTFSNGFSIRSERAHMEQLKPYIADCHRAGIHVFAYQSIANMFWEDMFENVPESKEWVRTDKDGKPTAYGAATYSRMGRVTRYMARLSHPGWQEYLRKRVDLAIEAGADGIFYDNNFNESLPEVYGSIYRHASARKRDVLLMGNFHENTYALNHLTNAISTEDGWEPGVYPAANAARIPERLRGSLLAVDGGLLVSNIGLFRTLKGLSDGWKPVMVEHGRRETGDRMTTAMSGPRHQLAIAEAAACGAALELFSEGAFADALWRGKPEAMEIWRGIGRYHRFLAENEALYRDAISAANVAIVLDDTSAGIPLLNGLAARNILFDVLYEHDLAGALLERYSAVVPLARNIRPRAQRALDDFAAQKRKLVPASAVSADELARTLRDLSPVSLDAPGGVVLTAAEQPSRKRLLVHLLNYTGSEKSGIRVTVKRPCGKVTIASPDGTKTSSISSGCTIELPRLGIYSVVIFGSDGI